MEHGAGRLHEIVAEHHVVLEHFEHDGPTRFSIVCAIRHGHFESARRWF